MGRSFLQFQGDTFLPPLQQPEAQPPYFLNLSEPNSPFQHTITTVRSDNFSLNDKTLKVSPSILLIIIILAIVFFISGLLHLLVRFLWRPQTREADDLDSVTALQGQLQQLFHLHDSGVDQSFIDTLPVFLYKAIIGLKNPFDCAVCLCEFEPDDKLRLLPKCSHAFHMECIDTWLLSHSTCPLCRATLLPDFSSNNNHTACSRSPIALVLESGSDSSREIVEAFSVVGRSSSSVRSMNVNMNTNSHLCGDSEFGSTSVDENENPDESVEREKVVTVKLGKFRNVDLIDDVGGGDGEGSSSTNNVDARRCFSMGSFAYVMDETSSLQVPIRTPMKQQTSKKKSVFLPLTPGQRPAMSECGCESRRDFRFSSFEDLNGGIGTTSNGNGAAIGRNRKESFSISKIWLRGKKDKSNSNVADSSRRAVSFRFPLQSNVNVAGSANTNDDLKGKSGKFDTRSSLSEMDIVKWGSEFGYDEENQSCYSMDSSQARVPSFARRTLLWLTGRQNKVVHSSSASTLSFFGNNFL